VAALLRVSHLVLAVNKMDLVDYAEDVFDRIVTDFAGVALSLSLDRFTPIPIAALSGDNVVDRSTQMDWYTGPALLEFLEELEPGKHREVPARFPVQMVLRPRTAEHPDYRGYAGRVEAGALNVGDPLVVLPSGRHSTVAGIDTPDGPLDTAAAGRSVVVRLADDVDVARGDLLAVDREPRPAALRELVATVCWLADRPLRPGDRFALRHTTRDVRAVVDAVRSRLDVATLDQAEATELSLNDIGSIQLRTAEPLTVDTYATNRSTGAFLLVDEATGATVAAGMVAGPAG
jgi:sulfate adenylyltransferase subunit 1